MTLTMRWLWGGVVVLALSGCEPEPRLAGVTGAVWADDGSEVLGVETTYVEREDPAFGLPRWERYEARSRLFTERYPGEPRTYVTEEFEGGSEFAAGLFYVRAAGNYAVAELSWRTWWGAPWRRFFLFDLSNGQSKELDASAKRDNNCTLMRVAPSYDGVHLACSWSCGANSTRYEILERVSERVVSAFSSSDTWSMFWQPDGALLLSGLSSKRRMVPGSDGAPAVAGEDFCFRESASDFISPVTGDMVSYNTRELQLSVTVASGWTGDPACQRQP